MIPGINSSANHAALRGGGVPPADTPITLLGASCIAWWTADAGITLSGDTVTAWVDQVAGYPTTPAGSPQFEATGFNGNPCIEFNGTDNCFESTDAGLLAALPDGAEPGEIWAIFQQDALVADTGERFVVGYGATTSNGRFLARAVTSGVNRGRARVGTGSPVLAAHLGVDLSSRHVLRGIFEADETNISVDGNLNGTPVAAVPATSITRLRIGATAATTAANFLNGKVREVIFTGPLDAGQVTALEAYALPRRAL